MADKLTKEDIKEVFNMIAEEMIKECGDWENKPETDEDIARRERVIKKVLEQISKLEERNVE